MADSLKINRIFSTPDVKHGLSLFTPKEINVVEKLITEQDGKLFIKCQIKDKQKIAKPEEIVRQLWIYRLLTEYGYPRERVDVERVIYFGSRDTGLADLVVFHEDLAHHYVIFEVKRPSRKAGLEQLRSYCNAEGAPIGVWSNGNEMIRLHREEPNIFIEIPQIPTVTENLRDILSKRWTIEWLEEHDELKQGKTTLKKIILDLQELVLGNAGVKSFDEIFKLIYAKLYDEWNGINNTSYKLDFFVGDRSPEQVKTAISNLLEGAKRTWPGVFELTDNIELIDTHLKVCVSFLEKIKLFNSNLRVIDEAFEYLIPDVSKKKEGQFFTPRPVEDMIVKMLNPKTNEFVIDPACGSAGFLLHSVMWLAGGVITGKELPTPAKNFAQNNIYGIDFAKEAVKIAKAINLIVGDGKSHIYGGGPRGNSLNPVIWDEHTKSGLRPRLQRFPSDQGKDTENQTKYLYFDFDVLMTNPPFAGTVKKEDLRDMVRHYKLMEKNGRFVTNTGRHILFLERSLQFIRPGGRMAMVLPQGLLNNANTEYIRRFILEEARILAVVGLHGNTFKPHTGTKTSVLFLQKYTEKEKKEIQNIKAKNESNWDKYIEDLRVKYENTSWNTEIDEEKIPEELKSFTKTSFETQEELEEQGQETDSQENSETNDEKSLKSLSEELEEIQEILDGKEQEMEKATGEKRGNLTKEIRAVKAKQKKLTKDISYKTLAGQVSLTINEDKVTQSFKKFWIETKVIKEIDHPIFLAVNQNPIKDNRGEYRYKKGPDKLPLVDEHGHPQLDVDLEEIAEAFVKYAKEQKMSFWR